MDNLDAHPYIPNAAHETHQEMLSAIGVNSVEELFASIPENLRLDRPLDIPKGITSESQLVRHMESLLRKNKPTSQVLSFLGAGAYPHYVPAVCDEINQRAEFLTAYGGEAYEDHGKWQALFEYTSLMAELLEMDVVNIPTYDGYQATATALRMAGRITHRSRVICSTAVPAAKLRRIKSYLDGVLEIIWVDPRPDTGLIHTSDVAELLDDTVAAVYVETPNVAGIVEADGPELTELAHRFGALMVCGLDPLVLGYMDSPASWGADILCGDIQSLGLGLHFGGAHGGFIATHDDERFVYEFPSRLFGLAPTRVEGEIGFVDVAYERTSLAMREQGIEWVGTAASLWGITAGAYLALMGPKGLTELGSSVAARTRQAIRRLDHIPHITVRHTKSAHWREFIVTYEGASAAEINAKLLDEGIYGGAEATAVLSEVNSLGLTPGELQRSAIFCVTELHSKDDLEELASALERVLV